MSCRSPIGAPLSCACRPSVDRTPHRSDVRDHLPGLGGVRRSRRGAGRRQNNGCMGAGLGLLLGPIGVVIVLLMPDNRPTPTANDESPLDGRECPFCRKDIHPLAVICPYCRSALAPASQADPAPNADPTSRVTSNRVRVRLSGEIAARPKIDRSDG